MHFRVRNKSRVPAINVTSLIDVLFLLVIFVLLSAKFEPDAGIRVDLPQGKSRETVQNEPVTLKVTQDGTIFFEKTETSLEALPEAIRKMRTDKSDPVLVIEADKRVEWERVVQVTDAAKTAGQAKINFKIKP